MHINRSLLQKYFKGNCTAEEQFLVEVYLAEEQTPELDELMQQTWKEVDAPRLKVRRLWYFAAAAVAAAAGIFGFFWQSQQGSRPPQQLAANWNTLLNNGSKVRLYIMPDGSEVWLNAHTTVSYTDAYNKTSRELWLQGEGYFKVVANDKKPFCVHTGRLTTTVLGTEFNIATANKADGSIQVSLVTGKVSVTMQHAFTKVLLPGQMLSCNGDSLLLTHFEREEVLDWKSGRIVFNKTNLADVLTRLQQHSGYKFILSDSLLAGKKVSAEFKTDMPLEKILSALEYVHNLTCARANDSTYLVTKNK